MAEREGFEPSEQVTPLSGLANRRTRPLCDLSVRRGPMIARVRGASEYHRTPQAPEASSTVVDPRETARWLEPTGASTTFGPTTGRSRPYLSGECQHGQARRPHRPSRGPLAVRCA